MYFSIRFWVPMYKNEHNTKVTKQFFMSAWDYLLNNLYLQELETVKAMILFVRYLRDFYWVSNREITKFLSNRFPLKWLLLSMPNSIICLAILHCSSCAYFFCNASMEQSDHLKCHGIQSIGWGQVKSLNIPFYLKKGSFLSNLQIWVRRLITNNWS